MTTSLGGGHIATSNALAQAFELAYPDQFEITVMDVLKEAKVVVTLDKIFVPFYKSSVKNLRGYPYKAFFKVTDITHDAMRKLLSTVFKTEADKMITKADPDLVISTFWFLGYAASAVVKSGGWPKKVPVISIITDSGDVHKMWLMSNEDAVLVSTPETIAYAGALGAPKDIMHYLGFPLDSRFASLPTKQEARKKLGLDPNKFTVLVNGGGLGLNRKFLALARRIATQNLGAQYLLVAGRDPVTAGRLDLLKFRDKAKTFSFVENMPDMIAAADLVVGKAGWISLCEAFASKRPVIVMDMIPGQEEPNAELVIRQGAGWVLTDPDDAASKIAEVARNPKLLDPIKANLEKLNFDAEAGPKIARFIVENYLSK